MKKYLLSRLIAYGGKYLIRALLATCRIEVLGIHHLIEAERKSSCLLMLWHDKLLILPEILHRYTQTFICTALISKSRDGEPLAVVAESYPRGRALRVAHHARHAALLQVIALLKETSGVVLITPDGPRGPRHVIKPGIVMAAEESGKEIISFSWKASRSWKLNTWDQMELPKPFSKIKIFFSPPLAPSTLKEMSVEEKIKSLEKHIKEGCSDDNS